MRGGLIESYRMHITLQRTRAGDDKLEGGTRLTIRFEITPRTWAAAPIAWMVGRSITGKLEGLGRRIDAHVVEGAPSPYVEPVSETDTVRLASSVEALKKEAVDPKLADKLGELVL